MPAPRFICDSMLGRLAKSLRMLGFDALYARQGTMQALVQAALAEQRIILTRRSAFPKETPTPPFVFLRSNAPAEQLQEVIAACALKKTDARPFTICLHCNARLAPISRETAQGRVPEYVFATVDDFTACPLCRRVYWKGTHYERMAGELEKIMGPQVAAACPSQ